MAFEISDKGVSSWGKYQKIMAQAGGLSMIQRIKNNAIEII